MGVCTRSCIGCSSVPSCTTSARLQSIWYDRSTPPWPLRALSALFALVVSVRAGIYASGLKRRYRISKPVIVVGNLTVGGTGKTPLVIWLVEQLRAQGLRPGVVLRGYGGNDSRAAPRAVEPDSDPAEVGDEAVLLRLRTGAPVMIGRDRVRAAQKLVSSAGVDVVIADDGLQHLRLARDFEIAVIDAARGLGNGYLLPAGPLREPRERLTTVSAIVLNGNGAVEGEAPGARNAFTMRLSGEQLWPLSGRGQPNALGNLSGQRVHAIAGIGNPQRFFTHLSAAGLEVLAHPFPDHHRYQVHELEFGDALPVLMTEKDAVKCRAFAALNGWYLPVAASFAPEESAALLARLQLNLQR
jgi:tetraacyldisaccharide 4'-kinase